MAAKVAKNTVKPASTGAVSASSEPITTTQLADIASTGAAEYVAPGTTRAEHIGADVVVTTKPVGPITTTAPWAQTADVTAPSNTDEKVETK